jgi:DNA mismatch repair protein MutL
LWRSFSLIAAIAHVEMKTKQEQEELGTHIIEEGSNLYLKMLLFATKELLCSQKFIFNIPARRNF